MNASRGAMILVQGLTAFMFYMFAIGVSTMDGYLGYRLEIPFSGIAGILSMLAPVAALTPIILPRRLPCWRIAIACNVLAVGLLALPPAIYKNGVSIVPVPQQKSLSMGSASGLDEILEKELGFPIRAYKYRGTVHLHFSRMYIDASDVEQAISRQFIGPNDVPIQQIEADFLNDKRTPSFTDVSGAWTTGHNFTGTNLLLEQKGEIITGYGYTWGCVRPHFYFVILGTFRNGMLSLALNWQDQPVEHRKYNIGYHSLGPMLTRVGFEPPDILYPSVSLLELEK